MIGFDTDGVPVIALADREWTNQDAQVWVKDHQAPMLVLDGGRQFALVYPNASGSPVIQSFWGVKTQAQAIEAARQHLASEAGN